MTDDEETVNVSMEISGSYDDVLAKLGEGGRRPPELRPVVADLTTILETVERIDGGTRSAIASALPDDTVVEYDPEAVVGVMQMLERYDLVTLDGNTWNPGPALAE